MKILAIDPGFERIGIAILEKKLGKEELVYSECFKTSVALSFSLRLRAIGEKIKKTIENFNPQELAIETLIFNTNQKTVMKVSEARGVILYEASLQNIKIFEYTPLQVKIAVTGYGRATKNQVTSLVKKLIVIPDKKRLDDEYDAIAIGLTHMATVRY